MTWFRNDAVNARPDLPRLRSSLGRVEMSLAGALEPRRVLVADNDPLTNRMLSEIAEKEGYQVVSVSDGREAYRILKSDSDFKAAVINITMPNLRGLDILRHMKTEKRLMRIPVLVVSGDPGLKQMAESFAAGAAMFLPKPLTQDQLRRTLRIALNSRESKRQLPRAA